MREWKLSAWRSYVAASMIAAGAAVWPALAAEGIEPEANRILTAMSDDLKSMKTFSVDYDADQEIVTLEGQKLQYSASGSIVLDRKKGFRMKRKGPFAEAELVFDGATVSLHDQLTNAYVQLQSPGSSFEDVTEELRATSGLDAPGADLLSSDPYAVLTDGVTEGVVVGTAFVDGVECDHLAFRTDVTDWQIWISKDGRHVPLKYVITTKWTSGSPQYLLRMRNWTPDVAATEKFQFTPSANARKLDRFQADAVGEILLEAGQ